MKKLILVLNLILLTTVLGKTREVVKYEYEKYQLVDLGALSVKGKIITPTDLSVTNTKFDIIREDLYERVNFIDVIGEDNNNL
jgi:hypothetical protein